MSYRPGDSTERERALDITGSFCVQAPAGSGKTELLTQRLLKLLAHVQQPEDILAFTFTRKAAAEMRERLLQSLHEARELGGKPSSAWDELQAHKRSTLQLAAAVLEQNERQGWQLLQNSQRLRVNTIDSFTAWLSAQLPLSASLGARAVITTDMEPVFAAAIRATLAQLESATPVSAALQQLLPHLQNNLQTAEKLLQKLLEQRDQWLPLVKALEQEPSGARTVLEATLRDMLETQLRDTSALLAPFQSELCALLAFAAGNLQEQPEHELHLLTVVGSLPGTDAKSVASWRILTRFLLRASLDGFRSAKGLQNRHGFPGQKEAKGKEQQATFKAMKEAFGDLCTRLQEAGCLPMLQMVARLPDPHYSANQWQVLNALCALLPVLAAQLNVAMQDKGVVDHTETSLAALRALGGDEEPTDLALRLDYRIRHILVDEFQDTSSLQFHLLEKLTLGWESGDGRTLFIVGDGMQSCYAFRNAKVSLFLKARNEGIGTVKLQPLDLQVNFRSDSSVVHWVNTVFSQAFPRIDDLARGGVRYSHSEARSPEPLTPGVHAHLWVDAADTTSDSATRQQLEAATIAQLCQRLQQEDPEQSIAVLVRSRGHLRELVPALRAQGLRWNASKIDRLLSYPDITDLFTLLRALLSIADSTAWLALLRTPFVGLALADLHALAIHSQAQQQSLWSTLQQHEAVTALGADARARLQRCVPLLQEARKRRQLQPLREVLEALWIALGGPATLQSPALLPNVASFFALVEQHAQQGDIPDIHSLEAALDKTYGSAVDAAVKLQLMTIHNAKGLEFDVVLIPGLERLPRANGKDLLLWHEHLDSHNRSRPLLGLLPEKGQPEDPLYDYLRFEHAQRDALEATRLLYIAVTRAAKAAWLFGYVKEGKDGLKAASSSLLQQILPALDAQRETLQLRLEPLPTVAPATGKPEFVRIATQALRRLPGTWQAAPERPLWPAPAPAVEDDPLHQQLLARSIGELVHLGLKQIVERGADRLLHEADPPLWRRTLAPLCQDAAALNAALGSVREQLRKCVQSPELGWLFRGKQRDDACELALVTWRNGYRCDFVIDRTFIDANGTRWIIDYKSATPGKEQSLAAFVQEQSARYRPQLLDYAALFQDRAQPLKLALLLTALPALHLLET
jgi:ATP-dependent exoDNAse (exonuclease V) beta subunit